MISETYKLHKRNDSCCINVPLTRVVTNIPEHLAHCHVSDFITASVALYDDYISCFLVGNTIIIYRDILEINMQ